MASTSGPSHTRYDVFLSFRGEDTRNSFTDHLYKALVRAGLRTFRDDDEIGRGAEIKPELIRAITESRASIVVLSNNYACSRWCLDELVLILEQRKNISHFVLPVFYHVDPSDVRNQRLSFSIEAVEGSEWTEVKVNRWKAALTEVSNLAGMVVSGSETDFIAKVVDTVYCKLDLKLLSTPAHLTGMDSRAEVINSWLKDEESSTNIVAVFGMGGSGKTTLAQYIYNSNKQSFESSSFLQDIAMHNKQPDGLLVLQKQLLKDILGGRNDTISNVLEGTCKIEGALQMKRVLIVLDDIDDHDELVALLGTKAFHAQSKIIITTRHLDIHGWFGPISRTCHMYKLELLNDDESLELLSCHAFGSKFPMEGFEVLALQLAQYCEGNPLALKVLGSSLYVSYSESHGMIEIWRSTLNSLTSLKGDLDRKIEVILRKSFDSLPRDSDRELFLHISCFFIDEYVAFVVNILEDEWHVTAGIRTLVNKCLLTISPIDKLTMHQLLQEMGRKIVREESKDPAKRNIVWNDDESYRVLRKGKGSETIEDLALDMRNLKKGTKKLAFSTTSITKMDQLKFLKLRNVELNGPYDDFPELIWLSWQGSTLKTIPNGLLMSSLVAIDMSCGDLETFEPPTVLDSAKIVNLYGCRNLVSILNLHLIPNLESLILWNCTSLTHVCETIGELENLGLLDLNGCNKLLNNKLMLERHLFSLPKSLQFLYLDYCDINDVPVAFHPQSFFEMSLAGNLFDYLPNNIDLKMLRVLNLSSCPNLKSILCLPSTLEDLYTDWCTSLEKITFQSRRFTLQNFVYEGCFNLSEIQGLFKLVSISKLDESYLGHMKMKWIKAYQDCEVDLVGDEITKGRIWHIQMLYEYGIRSTFLPGITDPSMITSDEYTSSSAFLSFEVPLRPKKCRIQGLNVRCLYRSKGADQVIRGLFVRIINYTKDRAWLYNPVVYCKPQSDEDVVWLSHWPIGDTLDVGDQVYVAIIGCDRLIINGCGASLVYTDDDDGHELDQQETFDSYMKGEEVIGGDLSEFEVAIGRYYLCRRDHFKAMYLGDALMKMLGARYTGTQGWRKARKLRNLHASMMEQKTLHGNTNKEIVLGMSFNSEDQVKEIQKMVSSLVGVEGGSIDVESKRLVVTGLVDPETLANRMREFDNMVQILSVHYIY